jgi:fused signal recognition particle receptor
MFGSLKKKLQEAVKKVSVSISKEETKETTQEPVETLDMLVEKHTDDKVYEEIEKKKDDLEEIQEKLHEEKIASEVMEGTVEGEKIFEEVKEQEEEKVEEEKTAKQDGDLERTLDKFATPEKEDIEKLENIIDGKHEVFVGDPEWLKGIGEKKEDKKEEILVKEPEELLKDGTKEELSEVKTVEEIMDDISAGKITREDELRDEKELMKSETPLSKDLGIDIIGEKKTTEQVIGEEAQEKKGFLRGLIKKVAEKKLSEGDVQTILKELQIALLENDTSLEVAEKMCDDIKKELMGKSVKRGKIEDVIKDALRNAMFDVLKQDKVELDKLIQEKQGPYTIIVLGFNGAGKTTTVAKLASMYKSLNPVVAAGDTFRAASIEQLEEHGKRIGVEVVKHSYGADSAAVIFDAKKHAEALGTKLVIADTAGRSHANVNLMDELKKVCKVNSPDLKILVLDALTGNDIYEQSRLFNDAVGVDAIILTKVDVYDKGGAALSAAYTIKKPIIYLGTGQEYEELREFVPEIIINSLLN